MDQVFWKTVLLYPVYLKKYDFNVLNCVFNTELKKKISVFQPNPGQDPRLCFWFPFTRAKYCLYLIVHGTNILWYLRTCCARMTDNMGFMRKVRDVTALDLNKCLKQIK